MNGLYVRVRVLRLGAVGEVELGGAAALWCGVFTWVILKIVALPVRLRVSEEKETEGLDLAEHGERGYSP